MRPVVLSLLLLLAPASSGQGKIRLFLLPHTHADVGWLETPEDLARVNVSRILDGVVGNLANDTLKRRRFVWDEMYFLQWWWDNRASASQKATMRNLVHEGRIEFVDNGWSQADMGCTTYDSLLNNWVEGHMWIKEQFGAAAAPHVGWSLDPFGLSTTQAVLQSLMGFDAWFFTRVPDTRVVEGKQDKTLEFVWRASSSLPAPQTEIFAHIFESYYCMPLPEYAFELGPGKGAPPCTAGNKEYLAQKLVNMTKVRAQWFRTENVLIPWGCDYQYQNAEVNYNSTDVLIDTINSHAAEWGVTAEYCTASEYLTAIQESGVVLPVKDDKQTFFPYNSWSGFFTSRPRLKQLSQAAHGPLRSAEALYALRTPSALPERQRLWALLETARRNAGVVQHHDAITGSMCDSSEGCTGAGYMAQVMGAHNVLEIYEEMVGTTASNSNEVIAAILSEESGLQLTPSVQVFGQTLMDQRPIQVVLYNSLGFTRTEMASIQVPICNVGIVDAATGAPVKAQVTAQFTINDGIAPYYDFDLHFKVRLPPFSYATYTITPLDSTKHCGGNLMARDEEGGAAAFRQHEVLWPAGGDGSSGVAAASGLDALFEATLAEQRRMMSLGQTDGHVVSPATTGTTATGGSGDGEQLPLMAALENQFLKVYIDTSLGVQAVLDKGTGRNFSLTHELVEYQSKLNRMAAYDFVPAGMATPVLNASGSTRPGKLLRCTISRGPVMQEARFQISAEHKTRVRLFVSDDPAVGGRLEFGHRIGVLEPMSEIASRFTARDLATAAWYSEDNGYETIEHATGCPGCDSDPSSIPYRHFPSQMSVFLSDGQEQLSIALEHSHGVASLMNGTLDVVQHRRITGMTGVDGDLALDDSDRIFTQTWLSIGNVSRSNTLRHSNKLRLNHPLSFMFADQRTAGPGKRRSPSSRWRLRDPRVRSAKATEYGMAPQLHMQNIRATSADASELMLSLTHILSKGEHGSEMQDVDLNALLGRFKKLQQLEETTINGVTPISKLARLHWNTTHSAGEDGTMEATALEAGGESVVSLHPFSFRTFLAVTNVSRAGVP
jgi:hypothetical protein